MMKWILVFLAVGGLCTSVGCGGRTHLTEDGPRVYSRLMTLQANHRPRHLLAPLSALDAKLIMSNHAANHSLSTKGKSRSSGGSSGARQSTSSTLKRVGR